MKPEIVHSNMSGKRGRRGQAIVEFALVFLLFLSLVMGFIQISFFVWTRTTLHFAVREGIRFAITGATLPGLGHDDSIKTVVTERSLGMLVGRADKIAIEYFDSNGDPTALNSGGNTIVVSVKDYELPVIAWAPLYPLTGPLTVEVSAVDKLEPFRTAPPR